MGTLFIKSLSVSPEFVLLEPCALGLCVWYFGGSLFFRKKEAGVRKIKPLLFKLKEPREGVASDLQRRLLLKILN